MKLNEKKAKHMSDNFINQNLPEEKGVDITLRVDRNYFILAEKQDEQEKDIAFHIIDDFLIKDENCVPKHKGVNYGAISEWIMEYLSEYQEGLFCSTQKPEQKNSIERWKIVRKVLSGNYYPPSEVYLERRRTLNLSYKGGETQIYDFSMEDLFRYFYYDYEGKSSRILEIISIDSDNNNFKTIMDAPSYISPYIPRMYGEYDKAVQSIRFEFQYLKSVPFWKITEEEKLEYLNDLILAKERDVKLRNFIDDLIGYK